MITQRKSWLVATVAMMLLVPVKGLAYEVGDEFRVEIQQTRQKSSTSTETITETALAFICTVTDPANHKVAIWKRYGGTEVNEENILQSGSRAYEITSGFNVYNLPDEVVSPDDGETYTITAVGANAFSGFDYVLSGIPHHVEMLGKYAFYNVNVGDIDFSAMPNLKVIGSQAICLYNGNGHTANFTNAAVEEVYSNFMTFKGDALAFDFAFFPKLKIIHTKALDSWRFEGSELHIPAHVELIEKNVFIGRTNIFDVYFEHTSADAIVWGEKGCHSYHTDHSRDPYTNRWSEDDFSHATYTNIHVCDEILQQCKDNVRNDLFNAWYDASPSCMDPEAAWESGRGFVIKTPVSNGTVDLIYTISDYDKREVFLYRSVNNSFNSKFGELSLSDDQRETNMYHDYVNPHRLEGQNAFINYTGTGLADLTIPETVTGPDGETYKVVCVGNHAFDKCDFINKVTMPQNIRIIGAFAFNESSLNSANFMELANLSKLCEFAFYKTNIGGDIVLPDGVTKLYGYTFAETKVTSFRSNKIKIIGAGKYKHHDFYGCTELTTVTFDDALEIIGFIRWGSSWGGTYSWYFDTFTYCVGEGAFEGCSKLATVNFSKAGNLHQLGHRTFKGTALSGDFVIPEGIRYICDGVFSETGITSVKYPSTLIYDFGSLRNNNNLKSADLSNCPELKAMMYTFYGCENLEKIDIQPAYKQFTYMYDVLDGCKSLSGEFVVPDGLQTIVGISETQFTKIIYPKSATNIGARDNSYLAYVNFSELENLDSIEYFNANKLQGEIMLCDKVRFIGSFEKNPDITKFTVPAAVERIDFHGFRECENLADIYIKRLNPKCINLDIPDDWKYIAMKGPHETKIHVSKHCIDQLKNEEDNGFLKWYKIDPECIVEYDDVTLALGTGFPMTLPLYNEDGEENGETTLVRFTITDLKKQEIAVFPGVYGDNDYYSGRPYYDVASFEADFYRYFGRWNEDTWLHDKNALRAVNYIKGEGILILPEKVKLADGRTYTLTYIGRDAFREYDKHVLQGILMPPTIRKIGDYAFYGCSNLSMVMFDETFDTDDEGIKLAFVPEEKKGARRKLATRSGTKVPQLEYIGKNVFNGVQYPVIDFKEFPNLKTIDDYAFAYCKGYGSTLDLGTTVETIGEGAFEGAELEGTIELPASLKRLGAKAFNKNDKVSRVNFKSVDVIWEGNGELSENFAEGAIVGAAQSIIDQCATGTRKDQFRAYFPNQLVSLGGSSAADLTGDGKVDKDDIDLLRKYVMGDHSVLSATAADVNKDGVVNVADIVALVGLMIAMGK